MSTRKPKQSLVLLVASLLVADPLHLLYGQEAGSASDTGNPTQPAAQSAAQLQALVAPIALYPDSLVAQILTAATFPDQVAIANYWVEQNKNLTGSALMQAVDKQSWDPSVKALTQFPSVLGNLASNLAWTSSLGEALSQSAVGSHDRNPDIAGAGEGQGHAAIQLTNHCRATIPANDRHSAH